MKTRTLLLLFLLGFSLLAAGCIDSATKITVNKDGSGMITETVGVSREIVKQYQQTMPIEEGQDAGEGVFFKEEDFIEKASEYGPNVRLVDFQTRTGEKSVYAQAVFEFDDVTQIRLKQDNIHMGPMADSGEERLIAFDFDASAAQPTLKVIIPQQDSAFQPAKTDFQAPAEKPSPAETAAIKQIFGGMRFAGFIEVNGRIISTNAQHVKGSTITLFDVEFDKILDRPELFAQLQASQSVSEAQELLKGLEGLKFETGKEVSITFGPSAVPAAAGSLDEAVAASSIGHPFDILALFGALAGAALAAVLIIYMLLNVLYVWFFARILGKAGFSWALALLLFIPVINGLISFILLMVLAFVDWPVYDKFAAVSDEMIENDTLKLDEAPSPEDEPQIELDNTAAFASKRETPCDDVKGVPLPGENNHFKGSLDNGKIQPPAPENHETKEEAANSPGIIVSGGGMLGGGQPDENKQKEQLSPQQPPLDLPMNENSQSAADKEEASQTRQQPQAEKLTSEGLSMPVLPEADELKLSDDEADEGPKRPAAEQSKGPEEDTP